MSIVEDTERTQFCPQTDRRTDRQMDKVIPVYPAFNFVEAGGHYTRHTFWSCLIRCANMKWIRWVLLKIQSGRDSVHRWTDGQTDRRTRWSQYTSLSTSLKRGYNKLEMYGIRGTANKWIESYLTDRYQFVQYDTVSSSKKKIICGVPQGSILGSLLFLIYINDLVKISTKYFTLMFAEDTSIFISASDIYMMEKTLNDEMKKVDTWLKVNKLSLNISKTHFMLFKGNKTAHCYPKYQLTTSILHK